MDLFRSHIKNRRGGFDNYRNAMQRIGLLRLSEIQDSLTESSTGAPSGRALAEAFQSVIEDTTYFKRFRDEYHVPRSAIEEYGEAACLCQMRDAPDGDGPGTESGSRSDTLCQQQFPSAAAFRKRGYFDRRRVPHERQKHTFDALASR